MLAEVVMVVVVRGICVSVRWGCQGGWSCSWWRSVVVVVVVGLNERNDELEDDGEEGEDIRRD